MNFEALHRELTFRTSRSSGSGGQHVNKVETKVELIFDVKNSLALSEKQKKVIFTQLENRINKEGHLLLSYDRHRSQSRNKRAVIIKFDELIKKALRPKPKRKKVKPPKANPQKRLKNKKMKSEKKAWRSKIDL